MDENNVVSDVGFLLDVIEEILAELDFVPIDSADRERVNAIADYYDLERVGFYE